MKTKNNFRSAGSFSSRLPYALLFSVLLCSVLLCSVLLCSVGCSSSSDEKKADSSAAPPALDIALTAVDSAPAKKRFFTTSSVYSTDLRGPTGKATGLEAADYLCNLSASGGALSGTWKAWISDATADAIDRIIDVGPLYQIDGTKVFNNRDNLATTPIAALSQTEHGTYVGGSTGDCVWTNTLLGGHKFQSCFWDATMRPDGGGLGTYLCNTPQTYGRYSTTSSEWTHVTGSGGFDYCHLYCIEQ